MNIASPAGLTIDGVNYPLEDFSETVQRLVAIRTQWQNELQTERLNVAKTEAAMRSLDVELTQTVSAELVAKAEEAQAAEVATDVTETTDITDGNAADPAA